MAGQVLAIWLGPFSVTSGSGFARLFNGTVAVSLCWEVTKACDL